MHELVSIGTVSVDQYFKGETLTLQDTHFHLACGGKYFVNFFHAGLGGGATNVAVGVKKNGLSVALMAKIGNNVFKELILKELKAHGIAPDYCDFEDNYYNVSSILLTEAGEKTVINYRTPHAHYFSDMHIEKLPNVSGVYFANMPDASVDERVALMNSLSQRGIQLFVNLGVQDCRREPHEIEKLLRYADVVIVNDHEFADLSKIPYQQIDFKSKAAGYHVPFLHDKTVVVTHGPSGSYGYLKNDIIYQPAIPQSHIVDTTGAGDGYTAGFIAHFIKTKNLQAAMQKGAEYASSKLSHLGAN